MRPMVALHTPVSSLTVALKSPGRTLMSWGNTLAGVLESPA